MERSERLSLKLKDLGAALQGLSAILELKPEQYDTPVADAIRNGKIQKFEYCVELFWKAARDYLLVHKGVDELSPKGVVKALFQAGILEHKLTEDLLEAIDDRNRMSHIYSEAQFQQTLDKLGRYFKALEQAFDKF
jgi:nucleotidyltransferase substrate binding protein (TIGR01987 family)